MATIPSTQPASSNSSSGAPPLVLPPDQAFIQNFMKKVSGDYAKFKVQQMAEASAQGVPDEHILGELLKLAPMGGQAQPSQAMPQGAQPAPQQAPAQPQQPSGGFLHQPFNVNAQTGQVTPESILGGLIKEHPSVTNIRTDTALKGQEFAGKKPLQAGEREKLDIEGMNSFYTKMAEHAGKPMAAESAKVLGNVDSGLKQIDQLMGALEQDPSVFQKWTMPGDPERSAIITMNEDLADILGRLRSGGAINKDEESRFRKQLLSIGPVRAILQDPKTAKFKLTKLKQLFSDIRQSVAPTDEGIQQKVSAALQAGFTREEVYQRLREKGSF